MRARGALLVLTGASLLVRAYVNEHTGTTLLAKHGVAYTETNSSTSSTAAPPLVELHGVPEHEVIRRW